MPTKILQVNNQDVLTGSPEKRIEQTPDGTLWACTVVASTVTGQEGTFIWLYRSTDGGTTWTASNNKITVMQSFAYPSFFIDKEGYAHISYVAGTLDPQVIYYLRGTPNSSGTGWTWSRLTINPGYRLANDTDIVAFRRGTGWVVWISYSAYSSSSGGHCARVGVSASGTVTLEASASGPLSQSSGPSQPGSLEFTHTGDGRTPTATPHVLYTMFKSGTSGPLYVNRARYDTSQGSGYSWETPIQVVASANVGQTALATVFDGTRLMLAYGVAGSATIACYEWNPSGTTITARTPPAAPGGVGEIQGVSLACDPATGDIWLAFYDATDGDVRWSKFTRSTLTWSAWAIAISQTPPGGSTPNDGKLQLVRHPQRDTVDMLYGQGAGGGQPWSVWYTRLASLARAPGAPVLTAPGPGVLADLASGYTFSWTYSRVSPSDTQQGWYMRRTPSGGSVEYWNATTQAWQAGSVMNNGTATSVTFPSGKWTTAVTYTWSVRSRSSTGVDGPWAADRTVRATTAPVVTVTDPNGVIYGDSNPIVAWTYTNPDIQQSAEVAVFTTAQAAVGGFDPATSTATWTSGVISSANQRSIRVTTVLTDGGSYVAYVRATSSAGVVSAWASSSFSISIAAPVGPTLACAQITKAETGVPRVQVTASARSNFMGSDQSIGQAGWVNDTNTTVGTQAEDPTNQIAASIKMTSIAAGAMTAITAVGSPPPTPPGSPVLSSPLDFPVIAGAQYTALASFKANATTRNAQVIIRWYDNDDGTGLLLSESTGSLVAATSATYAPAYVTATAPVGAKLARVVLRIATTSAAGEIFLATALSFAAGNSSRWGVGGYDNNQSVQIQRSNDGGATWLVAASSIKTDFYQRAVFEDRASAFNSVVRYRALTIVTTDYSIIASDLSDEVTITPTTTRWMIRDSTDDLAEINAAVVGFDESDDESSSVHRPAGRKYPVVDTEGLQAGTGYLDVYARRSEVADVRTLLKRTAVFILQSPAGRVLIARLIQRDYSVSAISDRTIRVRYVEVGPGGTGEVG